MIKGKVSIFFLNKIVLAAAGIFVAGSLNLSGSAAENVFADNENIMVEEIALPDTEDIQSALDKQEYVEGEVIVVAEEGADLNAGYEEQLARVDEQAMELTADAAAGSDDTMHTSAAHRAEYSDAEEYRISVISSDTKTTQQLMAELYQDPRVISVEPNRVAKGASAYAYENDTLGGGIGNTSGISYHSEAGDLTPLQWGMENTGNMNTPEGKGIAGVDLGVPGWSVYRNNGSLPDAVNSSGTIAVLDSGMDVNHPDLKDVFYTFTPEQQSRFHCGEHGLNASVTQDSDKVGDLTDNVDHGTHVCGIAAAAWNTEGISGVANGAKLIGVRLESDEGGQTAASSIRAFKFLTDIAGEVDLKSANCSWSSDIGVIEFSFTLLVNQLGQKGAVTVFSAGNDNTCIDENIITDSFIDSPYLLVVGAMNPAGGRVGFSDFGETTVDVFAPGSQIISTVTDQVTPVGLFDEKRIYQYYYPETVTGTVALHDFSDGDAGGFQVYNSNPLENADAKIIGGVSEGNGTNDDYSYEVNLSDFTEYKPDVRPGDESIVHRAVKTAVMAVPVDEGTDLSDISFITARFSNPDDTMEQYVVSLDGFMAVTADGGTKPLTFLKDSSGYYNSASRYFSHFGWISTTVNAARLLESDPEAERIYLDEQGRMLIQVGLYAPLDITGTINMDDIAIGNSDAKVGAYTFFNGTSMAAPAVTGALAVVAKDEVPNSLLEEGEEGTGLQALKRAARLRSAVNYSDELNGFCATGGYVNLSRFAYTDTEDAPLAPVIISAPPVRDSKNRVLTVGGYFFGEDPGVILLDGTPLEVVSWSDRSIQARIPEGTESGPKVISVVTDNGMNKGLDKYPVSVSFSAIALYEEELSVPDANADITMEGSGKFTGGLVASGDFIYTFQESVNKKVWRLWRYSISGDEWSLCAEGKMPVEKTEVGECSIAPSENGVVVFLSYYNDPEDITKSRTAALFDYDVFSDSWSRREISCEIPDSSSIFIKDGDIFFVGGFLSYLPGDETLYLSVLRKDSDDLEILGSGKHEFDSYFSYPDIALTDGYIYIIGQERFKYMDETHFGMLRLKLDDNSKIVEMTDMTESLITAGVAVPGNVDIVSAIAGMPDKIFTVGSGSGGTDTYVMNDGENTLSPMDVTSSYYYPNAGMALWYRDKLYAMGFSPSEPDKMYFRATYMPYEKPGPEPAEPDTEPSEDPSAEPDEKTKDDPATEPSDPGTNSADREAGPSDTVKEKRSYKSDKTPAVEKVDAKRSNAAGTGVGNGLIPRIVVAAATGAVAVTAVLIRKMKRRSL